MDYKRSELSECELVTMKCIWDLGGSATCPQVIEELKKSYGMDYKVTTVYTFLSKLVDKGYVKQEKEKLTQYKAVRTEEDYRSELLEKTSQFWFDASLPSFVSSLVHMKKMSKKDKEALKQMINDL